MTRATKTYTTKENQVDGVGGDVNDADDINQLQDDIAKIWNTLAFVGATELTIDTDGEITVVQNYHTVDSYADAASDDLVTINLGTNVEETFMLVIRPDNDARSIVIKHGTGNILCVGGNDFTLDDEEDICILFYDAGLVKWIAGSFAGIPTPTAANDMIMASGDGIWVKKTKAEVIANLAIAQADGWIPSATWAYASASTITVPSGAAAKYAINDKIKWTQTTVRYGVIVGVADTVLTIAINTDFVVANAAITSPFYSHASSPTGFPDWFNWTPSSQTGWTGVPTGVYRFTVRGKVVTCVIGITAGTSNDTVARFALPFTNNSPTTTTGVNGYAQDNGVPLTGVTRWSITHNDSDINFMTNMAEGAWTASGTKRIYCVATYEAA